MTRRQRITATVWDHTPQPIYRAVTAAAPRSARRLDQLVDRVDCWRARTA